MQITFTADVATGPQTDNENYRAGDRVDLRSGQWLIDHGLAVAGWTGHNPDTKPDKMSVSVGYADMTVTDLRALAADAGIENVNKLRKRTLIALLEGNDG